MAVVDNFEMGEVQRPLSSAEAVFRGVIEGVYVGRYVPGQRLVEADLIKDFGVSRGSIREALNRLAAEGVIILYPHRGAAIRRLTRKEAQDILNLLEVLIGLACRLAALTTNSHAKERLKNDVESLIRTELQRDSYEFIRLRNRFYRMLLESGENEELKRILPSVQVHLVRTQTRPFTPAQEKDRLEDYRDMVDAILRSDPEAAEAAGRRHVINVTATLESVQESAFAPA